MAASTAASVRLLNEPMPSASMQWLPSVSDWTTSALVTLPRQPSSMSMESSRTYTATKFSKLTAPPNISMPSS